MPVFLLTMFTKGDQVDLSKAQRREIKALISEIVQVYQVDQGAYK